MVQFYIFSLIIDSVSCPDIWHQEPANPVHHHQDSHLKVGSNDASQPHVDIHPAAPPQAEGGARGIGM